MFTFRGWNIRTISLTLLCLLTFAATVVAQVDRATLNGTITDASGAVVPKARVELVSQTTGLHRETVTGSRGAYEVPALPIGAYTVTISMGGFKPVVIKDVEFAVGQARTIDAVLLVGAQAEVVEVRALEAVNRSTAEVGVAIESEQIKDIPLDGRNWAGLMALAPGAINAGNTDEQHAIRFNGKSLDDENYAFDGIDASGVQESAQKADVRLNISLDSVAEFRVSTSNYTAESGAAGGAQINIVSKTGTNSLHGSAFEFVRNDMFDAKTYFDNSPLPPLRMNQFGGSLGGPIAKKRTFLFINYEGLRQSLGDTQSAAVVPNAAERALIIATSPAVAPLVNAYPKGVKPNTADTTGLTDLTAPSGTDSTHEDYGMARIDHKFNDSTSLYVRGNIDKAFQQSPADSAGALNLTDVTAENFVIALQKVFSERLINEAKFGVNRSVWTPVVKGSLPISLSVGGFDGLTGSSKQEEAGTTFSWIDNLTLVRGRNTFKFGVDIRRIRLNNSGNAITTSSITYDTPGDFQHNLASGLSEDIGMGLMGMRRTFYMAYAQDEIKLTPNLTLNAGLRYEFYSVMHEVQGRSLTVSAACGGFCPEGAPFYKPQYHDFGPRLGLNWAPSVFRGKTVIRTGFGMYYGANQNDDFSDPTESVPPRYSATTNLKSNPPVQLFYGYDLSKPVNGVPTLSPKAIDFNRKDGYYENWDFNLQQQLPFSFVGQVGYVGSQGHRLFSKTTANGFLPGTNIRPIPSLSSYGLKSNEGNSNFNALQVSLQRRFQNGFLWQTQYMWSHAITDASIGAGEAVGVENNSCLRCDRSSTNQDVRHTFTTNAVYQLPFGHGGHLLTDGLAAKIVGGWALSGILSARTGLPVNITVSRAGSQMLDGITSGQRPNLVPGVSIYPAGGSTLQQWFNPTAFAAPLPGTWGNEPRYIGVGHGNYEIDTALSKRIAVSEHAGMTFRAEAFNLFNHPMFASPSASVGTVKQDKAGNWFIQPNAKFGQVTSILNSGVTGYGTPRRLQLSLRIDF
ncbi:MAG: TonB-dependent receptor [Acidobacteriia bacterium]|nr:TonB-dependent receptor [Terriglobia bacterium]